MALPGQFSPLPRPARVLDRAAGMRPGAGVAVGDVRAGLVVGADAARSKAPSANDALFTDQPGMVVNTLDAAEGLGRGFFNYDLFGSMLFGGAMGLLGTGFGWMAKQGDNAVTRVLGKVGGFFAGVKNAVQAPMHFMRGVEEIKNAEGIVTQEAREGATLSNWMSKLTKAMQAKAEKWFPESATARNMKTVAGKTAEVETVVNTRVGNVFRSATTALGKVLQEVDAPFHAKAGYHERRVHQIFSGLGKPLEAAQKVLTEHRGVLGDELHGKFNELHALMQAKPESVGTAANAQTLLKELREGIAGLRNTHVEDAEKTAALKAAGKAADALRKPLEKIGDHLSKIAFWRDVPGALERLPETIGQTNLHHAAVGGAMTAMSLAEAGHTTFQLRHDFKVLCRMIAEVEGIKEQDVSLWHALAGDVSPVLQAARNHFFGKYKWETVAETLAVGMNLALLKKGAGWVPMLGVCAAPMAGKMLADQNPMITMYETMEKMQAEGQPLGASMYADFIYAATAGAPGISGLDTRNPRARQMLTEEYAGARTTPAEVLKEISSGKMERHLAALEQRVAAEKPVIGKHEGKILAERKGTVQQVATPHAAVAANGTPHETPTNTKLTQAAHAGQLHATSVHAVAGA